MKVFPQLFTLQIILTNHVLCMNYKKFKKEILRGNSVISGMASAVIV